MRKKFLVIIGLLFLLSASSVLADQVIMVGNSSGVTLMCGSKTNVGDTNPFSRSGMVANFTNIGYARTSDLTASSTVNIQANAGAPSCNIGDAGGYPDGLFNFTTNLTRSNITQFNMTLYLDNPRFNNQIVNLSIAFWNFTSNDWVIVRTTNSTDSGTPRANSFNYTGSAARDFFSFEEGSASFVASMNTSATSASQTIYVGLQKLIVDYTEVSINSSNFVTLQVPKNNTFNFSRTINFAYNITSGANSILSCEVWNNETAWATKMGNQTRITVNASNIIQFNFSTDGDYLWNVLCNNSDGNNFFVSENFTTRIYRQSATYIGITNNASSATKYGSHVNWTILINDSRFLNYTVMAINDSGRFINQTFKIANGQSINFSDINHTVTSSRNYKVCAIFQFNNSAGAINSSLPTDTGACFIVNNSLSTLSGVNVSILTGPIAQTNLSCNFSSYDLDPIDTYNLTITYDWYKNGASQSINYSTVYGANLSLGENWMCSVTSFDGVENSSRTFSNNVTVGDLGNPDVNETNSNSSTIISGGGVIRFNATVSDANSSIDYVRVEIEDSNTGKINYTMILIGGINAKATTLFYEFNYTNPVGASGTYYAKFWVKDASGNIGNSTNRNLSFVVNQVQQGGGNNNNGGGGGGGGGTPTPDKVNCNIKFDKDQIVLAPDNRAEEITLFNFHDETVIPLFSFSPTNTSENPDSILTIKKEFTDVLPKDQKKFTVVLLDININNDIKTNLALEFDKCQTKYLNITVTKTAPQSSVQLLSFDFNNLSRGQKVGLLAGVIIGLVILTFIILLILEAARKR